MKHVMSPPLPRQAQSGSVCGKRLRAGRLTRLARIIARLTPSKNFWAKIRSSIFQWIRESKTESISSTRME